MTVCAAGQADQEGLLAWNVCHHRGIHRHDWFQIHRRPKQFLLPAHFSSRTEEGTLSLGLWINKYPSDKQMPKTTLTPRWTQNQNADKPSKMGNQYARFDVTILSPCQSLGWFRLLGLLCCGPPSQNFGTAPALVPVLFYSKWRKEKIVALWRQESDQHSKDISRINFTNMIHIFYSYENNYLMSHITLQLPFIKICWMVS